MKITVLILRSLLGLVYFGFGLAFLLHLLPAPKPPATPAGDFQRFAAVYFFVFLKVVETLSGFFLLINKYTALFLVIIFPVTINILLFHLFLEPSGVAMGAAMLLINLFLGYAYRKYYTSVFVTSPTV